MTPTLLVGKERRPEHALNYHLTAFVCVHTLIRLCMAPTLSYLVSLCGYTVTATNTN